MRQTQGVPAAGTAGAGRSDLRPKTFVNRAGKRYVLVGASFWQGMNLATNDASGDPPRGLRELDRVQAMGIAPTASPTA